MTIRKTQFSSEFGVKVGTFSSEAGFVPQVNTAERAILKGIYDARARKYYQGGLLPIGFLQPLLPVQGGGSGNVIRTNFARTLQATPYSQHLSLFKQAALVPELRNYKIEHALGYSGARKYKRFLIEPEYTSFTEVRDTLKVGRGIASVAQTTFSATRLVAKGVALGAGAASAVEFRGPILRAGTQLAKFAGTRALSFIGGPIGLGIGVALGVTSFLLSGSDDVASKDIEEAKDECDNFRDSLQEAYDNLEDLKLGPISMDYTSSGFCEGSGSIGRTGPDSQRQIATKNVVGRFSNWSVTAYSYRGYRFSDPDQGGGIDGAMSPLNSV